MAACRRIEDLADAYRRTLSDPVLLDSLPRQALVTQWTARRLLCESEAPLSRSTATLWNRVVGAPEPHALDGWSFNASTEAPEHTWRIAHNLYSGGHVPFHLREAHANTAERRCPRNLERYLLAGAAETWRRLVDGSRDAARILPDVERWNDHVTETLEHRHPPFWDMESLLTQRLGWVRKPTRASPTEDRTLDAAMRRLLRAIDEHPCASSIRNVLGAWAHRHHLRAWIGVRFPPAFAAAMAECAAEFTWGPADGTGWDTARLARAQADAHACAWQVYSVWWYFDSVGIPSTAELCSGWSAEDRAFLAAPYGRPSADHTQCAENDFRLTPALRAY